MIDFDAERRHAAITKLSEELDHLVYLANMNVEVSGMLEESGLYERATHYNKVLTLSRNNVKVVDINDIEDGLSTINALTDFAARTGYVEVS